MITSQFCTGLIWWNEPAIMIYNWAKSYKQLIVVALSLTRFMTCHHVALGPKIIIIWIIGKPVSDLSQIWIRKMYYQKFAKNKFSLKRSIICTILLVKGGCRVDCRKMNRVAILCASILTENPILVYSVSVTNTELLTKFSFLFTHYKTHLLKMGTSQTYYYDYQK